jgi:hypothetical protein
MAEIDFGGLLGSAAGGGLFGILGQIANRGFAIWERKEARRDAILAYEQEVKRWGHETVLLDLQMKQASESHEQDMESTALDGSWKGLHASLQAEAEIASSYRWVDAVRALTRPFLTLESQVAVAVIFFAASGAQKASIQETIVETITFIAVASALWWFGERAERKTKDA